LAQSLEIPLSHLDAIATATVDIYIVEESLCGISIHYPSVS
jgi:hypothetical protein